MHRPAWIRALTLLWGVWFTTALTEPAGILACAMHGGLPAQVSAAPAPPLPGAHSAHHAPDAQANHAGHAGHPAPAGHAAHAARAEAGALGAAGAEAHSSSATPSSPEGPPHDCCTCLGQCCTAAPVTTPSVVEVAVAREVQVDAVAPAGRRVESPASRDHTLPFANGPPIVA